ncbi:DUF6351 family protein [Acinetobacter indicus]
MRRPISSVKRLCNITITIKIAWDCIKSYDPAQPPASQNIATTTTDEGLTVPFIVREEVGYQNRDEYRFAVLYDPNRAVDRLKATSAI